MEFNDHKDVIVTYHGKFMETCKECGNHWYQKLTITIAAHNTIQVTEIIKENQH